MEPYDFQFQDDSPEQPRVEPEVEQPKKNSGKTGKLIALVVAVALVSGICGSVLTNVISGISEKNAASKTEQTAQASEEAADEEQTQAVSGEAYELEKIKLPEKLPFNDVNKSMTPTKVYSENVDAVVGIRTTGTTNIWGQVTKTSAAGSGFILTKDGFIVTNNHVVEDADTITIALFNGKEYEAKVIGGDSVNDVALLKIEAEQLQAVTIGDSEDLIVGEEVVAIGNPLGELTFTMTQGYISALDREINTSGTPINMLQTDCAINSGNSGGPLFDMNGNVIAVTTAKPPADAANGTTVEGIGFAIPINDVLRIVYDLQENGRVTARAYLGVEAADLDAQTAEYYSLPLGVYVKSVFEGSCAEKCGIKAGDIILTINGEKVESRTELVAKLNRLRAGDSAEITLYRSGSEETVTAVLDERPEEEEPTEEQQPQPQDGNYFYYTDPNSMFPFFNFG